MNNKYLLQYSHSVPQQPYLLLKDTISKNKKINTAHE